MSRSKAGQTDHSKSPPPLVAHDDTQVPDMATLESVMAALRDEGMNVGELAKRERGEADAGRAMRDSLRGSLEGEHGEAVAGRAKRGTFKVPMSATPYGYTEKDADKRSFYWSTFSPATGDSYVYALLAFTLVVLVFGWESDILQRLSRLEDNVYGQEDGQEDVDAETHTPTADAEPIAQPPAVGMRISTAAVVDTPEIAIHTVQMFESIKLLLNLDPHTSPLRTIQEANRRLNLPAVGRFRQQAIEVLQFVLTAATYYNAPSQSRVGRISTGVLVQSIKHLLGIVTISGGFEATMRCACERLNLNIRLPERSTHFAPRVRGHAIVVLERLLADAISHTPQGDHLGAIEIAD